MNLCKVISGGQTGVDQAALRAARAAGLETGGWAPKGWATEDGPSPQLAAYGLRECPTPGYPARTDANARDGDATLWLGTMNSSGHAATAESCWRWRKPLLHVVPSETSPERLLTRLEAMVGLLVLNVAGDRESAQPGIGERAELFLAELFRHIVEGRDRVG